MATETLSALLEHSIASTSCRRGNQNQALGLLVPVSCTHCCASTSGLSTWCSTRGLTRLIRWEI